VKGSEDRPYFLSVFSQPRAPLRYVLIGGGVHLVSFLLLGVAFFIITVGSWHALTRLGPYWPPTSSLLSTILAKRQIPQEATTTLPITPLQIPGIAIHGLVALGLIGFGVWLLFHLGPCQQNLICQYMTR
jgi:hypothetical protein